MRKVNASGIELITRYEGFRPNWYLDIVGVRTIGYGHTGPISPTFQPPLTQSQAIELLFSDLERFERGVSLLIVASLTGNQFAALVLFTYNLGLGALQRSTLRMRLNRGDYKVGNEFLKYCMAGGKKIPGLLRRRGEEAQLFMRPDSEEGSNDRQQ
jgi:lysozyme